ncbi:MAG TPA: lysylphosphatidylglycerol synthase transmembrane domain-containing protein [Steroidobacteraceae bacterium]|nr:lysylphosphatidylglycerol synthase transmembrane domain-containing protein [Steroidobacteraceae bacterium]
MTSRQARALLGFAIGGAFLYLAVRHASAADMAKVLGSAKVEWLAIALLVYGLELGARVIRWRALLSHTEEDVGLGNATSAFIIGYAANNVFPAKLGELVRVDLISRLSGIARMASLGTVVVERIFDILLILLMAGISIGLLVLPETLDLARLRSGMILLGLFTALLMIMGVCLVRSGISRGWNVGPAMRARLGNLVRGIHVLASPEQCARILALSLLIWALNAIAMWLIVFAFGVILSPLQTLLLVGIVGIAAVLPAPPAGLGILQYAFTLVFELLGKPSAIGLVASAAVQVVLLGSVTLVGAFLFFAIVLPVSAETHAPDG